MDDVDRAKIIEEQFTAQALERHRDMTRFTVSARFCSCCGDEIPKARRDAVKTDNCVECATRIEKGRGR